MRWHLSEACLERWRSEGIGPNFMKLKGRVLYRQVVTCPVSADQELLEKKGFVVVARQAQNVLRRGHVSASARSPPTDCAAKASPSKFLELCGRALYRQVDIDISMRPNSQAA